MPFILSRRMTVWLMLGAVLFTLAGAGLLILRLSRPVYADLLYPGAAVVSEEQGYRSRLLVLDTPDAPEQVGLWYGRTISNWNLEGWEVRDPLPARFEVWRERHARFEGRTRDYIIVETAPRGSGTTITLAYHICHICPW